MCDSIMQRLHDQCVVMLSQDSFYRGLTDAEIESVTSANLVAMLVAYGAADLPALQMALTPRGLACWQPQPPSVWLVQRTTLITRTLSTRQLC